MFRRQYQIGDLVVYRKPKSSVHPGPRAKNIIPAPMGENYSYQVDKYWAVQEVSADRSEVVLVTRTGKTHRIAADDPQLRHAHWWEQWRFRDRFPNLEHADSPKRKS